MTELSFSNTSTKKNELSSNLFSIFFNFCFSICSHPLYFSYFIFFSPYLLRLLSFLSPLFITTALLLVALLTFTPNNLVQEKCGSEPSSESKWGILLSVLQYFFAWLHSKADEMDEEMGLLAEVEAYLVMFQASIFEVFEPKSMEECSEGFEAVHVECLTEGREDSCPVEDPKPSAKVDENLLSQSKFDFEQDLPIFSARQSFEQDCPQRKIHVENQTILEEIPVEKVDEVEASVAIVEVKSLESLFQENEGLEDLSSEKEQKEVKPVIAELNKVEESKEKLALRSGSKVMSNKKVSPMSDGEFAFGASGRVKSLSQRLEANIGSPESKWVYSGKGIGNGEAFGSNNGGFGSMRVEKEWRRTLACKLFEERHNADGSEGMDMLWETYETESNKVLQKSNSKKGKKKKGEVEKSEDEEEEEEDMEGKLCCLQALKFSTGKMNLGMGRPNLLKFSKAIKGIGWLHKQGRKSNHSN